MITVSTSSETNRTYHHGDLRSALVEAGLKALETADPNELSLRQLAREVGVSATAVYRHFPDKHALLSALAETGLAKLFEEQSLAAAAAGGGPLGFAATGRAYVRFAIAHPGLFRLIFSHAELAGGAELGNNPAGRLLRANSEALSGGDAAAAREIQVRAWAIAHGLAMLILDGHLPADEALIDATMPSRDPCEI
ncbi:TetR/AcrR family transcriptional regulator [Novosphingobium sp. JCM 18896]|uniref:TetR/AcrR family transcriptional regulator n=1 Tax=Novosphingobium sp. JCM 18896 TaxID=2989731 RepID=UPI0022233AA2|nr:TetR/AcrR family transcriptional regulator [Novosphingobium sp. JCM 18896]MCW1428269.1 TetR/AcrR family transcriptional regulator [Novosphingobium sp. JCM 18896]